MFRSLILIPLAAALAGSTAAAQVATEKTSVARQETTERTAVSDALFAAAAADSGAAEVSLSELGLQKTTNADLKKFSQQMIEDHRRANQELVALARQKGIALPRVVDSRALFCAQSLAGLSGEKFDKCYAKAQLVAHMEAVATFEAESERGQDRDIKAFAAKTLPKLKEHLAMIKPIAMKYEKSESSKHEKSESSTSNEKNEK